MKKIKKKFLASLIVSLGIFCSVPVYAEKKQFDFTLQKGQVGRVAKASKADNDQYSYITMTGMTSGGNSILFVDKGSDYGPRSEAVFMNPSLKNQVNKKKYNTTVKPGSGYYLYYDNYTSKKVWITGRYNP